MYFSAMDWTHLLNLEFPQLPLDAEDEAILKELAHKLQDNYPYHSPDYAGQMIKPPLPLAQAAHWMTSFVNPNNHALDGGRATSALELETIGALGAMVGYSKPLGHLTSGGTTANLEALWVARQCDANTIVLANEHAHYTHSRMSEVLGMPFQAIPSTEKGSMNCSKLEAVLAQLHSNGVKATIVVTLGTTGMGAVDPLEEIVPLARAYGARIHVDAAYGGYFTLADLPKDVQCHFTAMTEADSIVIDPHKHGLQPYGCGAVLFKNPEEGRFYKHDSPYTYFTSDQLHLGEITLECSRAGAAAAALWATQQKFPYKRSGKFAQRLNASLAAAQGLKNTLLAKGWWVLEPELDICVFSLSGLKASEISAKNRAFFEHKAEDNIHLALFSLPKQNCPWAIEWDIPSLTVVRSVLMKPEHNDARLWERIART